MSSEPRAEILAEQRYVTVMLRLLVDRRGRRVRGEVVDVQQFQTPRRFVGWRGLSRALRALLAVEPHDRRGDGAEI